MILDNEKPSLTSQSHFFFFTLKGSKVEGIRTKDGFSSYLINFTFLLKVMGEFIKVMMTLWKSELDRRTEPVNRSVKGKMELGTFDQTK